MLIILILLLTFTDFELSGQKVETEAIYVSAKFEEFNFINILEHIIYLFVTTLYHVCLFIDICERTTYQFDQKILRIFFKKVVFGWLYSIQNDNNFMNIIIILEDYAKQLI